MYTCHVTRIFSGISSSDAVSRKSREVASSAPSRIILGARYHRARTVSRGRRYRRAIYRGRPNWSTTGRCDSHRAIKPHFVSPTFVRLPRKSGFQSHSYTRNDGNSILNSHEMYQLTKLDEPRGRASSKMRSIFDGVIERFGDTGTSPSISKRGRPRSADRRSLIRSSIDTLARR